MRRFGGAPPVAYMMRKEIPHRWVRIHSLPQSQRYPASHSDRAEIIRRHEIVATHALGTRNRCLLVIPSPKNLKPLRLDIGQKCNAMLRPFLRLRIEGCIWTFSAMEVVWRKAALRKLIHLSAIGEVRPVLANIKTGRAYAPYDGGADLFLSNRSQATCRWSSYPDWLSNQASGL